MIVSIVGTAGRKDDKPRLNPKHFKWMFETAAGVVADFQSKGHKVKLKSGGAAWADHVAVSLFLHKKASSLELCLPAPFSNSSYVEAGFRSPGSTSNYYHHAFSLRMGQTRHTSLRLIQRAIDEGAEVSVFPGFFNRNNVVGRCDVLVALTFSPTGVPKDGGTSHTWSHSSAPVKLHYDLGEV